MNRHAIPTGLPARVDHATWEDVQRIIDATPYFQMGYTGPRKGWWFHRPVRLYVSDVAIREVLGLIANGPKWIDKDTGLWCIPGVAFLSAFFQLRDNILPVCPNESAYFFRPDSPDNMRTGERKDRTARRRR